MFRLDHLGESGLLATWDDACLAFDPPVPLGHPAVLTWSEQERVAGSRAPGHDLAAHPALLRFLGREGTALQPGSSHTFHAVRLRVAAYDPIPYAVPAEAVRKTLSALRDPRLAYRRLRHTLRRPGDPPLIVEASHGGVRLLHLGQSLHRFAHVEALAREFGGAEVVVAGTDFEDEAATGRLLHAFGGRANVVADLVGTVRARLGLPNRDLATVLTTAPPGTRLLRPGQHIEWPGLPAG